MTNSFYDVAIVGGGPAGALLARQLAKSRRRVLLLEANETPKRKICGEYLCPKAMELLKELGLAKSIRGRSVKGMRLFSPNGIEVDSLFPGNTCGMAIPRDRLDPMLLDAAREMGAEIKLGSRLEGFAYFGGIWALKCGTETFRARVLIGADGRQSFVARTLGVQIPAKEKQKKRVALHFFAHSEKETAEMGEMHILKDGSYVGISPTGKNELNASLVCDADKAKAGGEKALHHLMAQSKILRERFLPLPASARVAVAFPITHEVRAFVGPSWALVGDAAGFLDPLTGEGIFQALHSADLLARRLIEAFDGASLATCLSSYASDHHEAFRPKKNVNRLFQTLIRHPATCDWVGKRMRANPARANAFIGIIGNVYSPGEGFKQILFPSASRKSAH